MDLVDQRLLFLPMQLLLTGLVTVVVWGPGLAGLLARRSLGARFRPLGIAAVAVVAVVFVSGGKPYYVAPIYVLLFAAGGVVLDRKGDRRVRGAVTTLAIAAVVTIPLTLPVLPASELGLIEPINPELGEMVGWPELAATAGGAFASLPDDVRSDAVILTTNYGNAAAIWRHDPDLPVYSAHNSFWLAGPPAATATTVVTVGYPDAVLERFCGSVRRVATVHNDAGLDNHEEGRAVQVCTDLTRSWPAVWDELRHLD